MIKTNWGGKRNGSGRPNHLGVTRNVTVRFSKTELALIERFRKNKGLTTTSEAIRVLVLALEGNPP